MVDGALRRAMAIPWREAPNIYLLTPPPPYRLLPLIDASGVNPCHGAAERTIHRLQLDVAEVKSGRFGDLEGKCCPIDARWVEWRRLS